MAYRRDKHGNEVCPPLSEDPRHYDSNTGAPTRDGYNVLCRRPRVAGVDECMEPEEASRIEGFYDDMDAMMTRPSRY